MKKALFIIIFLLYTQLIFAQNEIGPEGTKLIWVFLIIVVSILALLLFLRKSIKQTKSAKKPFFQNKKVHISIEKDRVYYPDNLKLTIKNTGNTDIDLDKPLLVLDNFWLKRKFKLKGMENRSFYPLYLEKGKSHTLQIDLNRFYTHDKNLKKYPKAKIILFDVNGKQLGNKSIFLRKTLLKF